MNALLRAITTATPDAEGSARTGRVILRDLPADGGALGPLQVSVSVAGLPPLFGPRHALGHVQVQRLTLGVVTDAAHATLSSLAERLADAIQATGLAAGVRVAIAGPAHAVPAVAER